MGTDENRLLFRAEFNPIIRTYILIYVALILIITIIGIPLALIWLLGIGQWYSRHYFNKLECELTERHLRFKKGILFQIEKTIPLENIQDLTFVEGPLLRALHLTVIKVETAGQSMHQGNEMSLIGIIDAPLFRQLLLRQRQVIKSNQPESDSNPQLTKISETLSSIEILIRQSMEKQ